MCRYLLRSIHVRVHYNSVLDFCKGNSINLHAIGILCVSQSIWARLPTTTQINLLSCVCHRRSELPTLTGWLFRNGSLIMARRIWRLMTKVCFVKPVFTGPPPTRGEFIVCRRAEDWFRRRCFHCWLFCTWWRRRNNKNCIGLKCSTIP